MLKLFFWSEQEASLKVLRRVSEQNFFFFLFQLMKEFCLEDRSGAIPCKNKIEFNLYSKLRFCLTCTLALYNTVPKRGTSILKPN